MTHITGIRFINWRCYRGEQTIENLRPITYAVTAQQNDNPDRSNWLGKSSFLEGPRFALHGSLRKEEKVDDFITRGEDEGGVELELSNGMLVSRIRRRGGPTILEVEYPFGDDKTLVARGEEAQVIIDRLTGGHEFFALTSFFAQGKTDQYVRMTPAERTEVVGEWLDLEALQRAEQSIRKNKLQAIEIDQTRVSNRAQYLTEQHGSESLLAAKIEGLVGEESQLLADLEVAREKMAEARTRTITRLRWQEAQDARSQVVDLKKKIQELPSHRSIDSLEIEATKATKAMADGQAALELSARDVRAAAALAMGQFEGLCPVTPDFKCPVTRQINDRVTENTTHHRQLSQALQQDSVAQQARIKLCADIRDQIKDARRTESTKRELNSQLVTANARIAQYGGLQEPEPLDEDAAIDRVTQLTTNHEELRGRAVRLKSEAQELRRAAQELERLKGEGAVYRAAALVLGRTGAQRAMAEDALHEMAGLANQAFDRAGVDLSVKVRWARPTNKLDEACRACGHYFGTKQAVKQCPACKTERPQALDLRLTLEMNAESGAAADLTGFVFQLSAATWLRLYRDRGLPVAFIDEPFGQVDRHNRLAFAARMHSMLEQDFGIQQSFVVAHDRDTLDTLPGRIEITSDRGNASVTTRHG